MYGQQRCRLSMTTGDSVKVADTASDRVRTKTNTDGAYTNRGRRYA